MIICALQYGTWKELQDWRQEQGTANPQFTNTSTKGIGAWYQPNIKIEIKWFSTVGWPQIIAWKMVCFNKHPAVTLKKNSTGDCGGHLLWVPRNFGCKHSFNSSPNYKPENQNDIGKNNQLKMYPVKQSWFSIATLIFRGITVSCPFPGFILWEHPCVVANLCDSTHSKIQDVDQEIGGSLLHNLTVLEAWTKTYVPKSRRMNGCWHTHIDVWNKYQCLYIFYIVFIYIFCII